MNVFTITLCLPEKVLHPNASSHWAVKAKAVKQARKRAYFHTLGVLGRKPRPMWKRAKCKATFYSKDDRGRDKDNLNAWLKSYYDGITDAGVMENDKGLIPQPPEDFIDKKNPRVVIEITEEPEEEGV